jgi:hypothetical protein
MFINYSNRYITWSVRSLFELTYLHTSLKSFNNELKGAKHEILFYCQMQHSKFHYFERKVLFLRSIIIMVLPLSVLCKVGKIITFFVEFIKNKFNGMQYTIYATVWINSITTFY